MRNIITGFTALFALAIAVTPSQPVGALDTSAIVMMEEAAELTTVEALESWVYKDYRCSIGSEAFYLHQHLGLAHEVGQFGNNVDCNEECAELAETAESECHPWWPSEEETPKEE